MGGWNSTGRGEYESGLVGHANKTGHLFSHMHTCTHTHTHTHRVRVFDHTVCLILYQMCLEVGHQLH